MRQGFLNWGADRMRDGGEFVHHVVVLRSRHRTHRDPRRRIASELLTGEVSNRARTAILSIER
jgi:hypothetical protein